MKDKTNYIVTGVFIMLLASTFLVVWYLACQIQTREYCRNLPVNEAFQTEKCQDYLKTIFSE